MRIFSRGTLRDFWKRHADAEVPLRLWFSMVEAAAWENPTDITAVFGSADFLANNRIVFNIKGHRCRLVAHVKYGPLFLAYIRFVGTHAEYNKIDATTI